MKAHAVVLAPRAERSEIELVDLPLEVAVLARERRLQEVNERMRRIDDAHALDPLSREIGIGPVAGEPPHHRLVVCEGALVLALDSRERPRLLQQLPPAVLGANEGLEVIEDGVVRRIDAPCLEERVDRLPRIAEPVTQR